MPWPRKICPACGGNRRPDQYRLLGPMQDEPRNDVRAKICSSCEYRAASRDSLPPIKPSRVRRNKLPVTHHAAHQSHYSQVLRAEALGACPPWQSLAELRSVYVRAKEKCIETGVYHHVDHIIPLNHPLVCGLHVVANLQIIPATDNVRKGNSFDS